MFSLKIVIICCRAIVPTTMYYSVKNLRKRYLGRLRRELNFHHGRASRPLGKKLSLEL